MLTAPILPTGCACVTMKPYPHTRVPTLKEFDPSFRSDELRNLARDTLLEEARRSGLIGGEKSEHVSFRVPRALLEAAKRETGLTSTSELGTFALAVLAQPDPVAAVLKRTRGRLGPDHRLDV